MNNIKIKLKTSELTGAALDWAVAKCEGIELESGYGVQETSGYYNRLLVDGRMSKGQSMLVRYIPSTDWAQGGPIIEREWLDVTPWPNESREDMRWHCQQHDTANDFAQYGPTLLIAAMRCYVASRVGDEIELPEELKEVMA
jgi:hypothetical protein